MRKTIFLLSAIVFCLLFISTSAFAKVSGICSNCHTMHNSQNGTDVTTGGPYEALVINNCLGCHSANSADTWKDPVTGAPIVYNISGPPNYGASSDGGTTRQGLAGGNFYWVKTDDAKGHNVFSDNPESTLTVAPGDNGWSGCGTDNCHTNIHAPVSNSLPSLNGRQGCTKCHMVDDVNRAVGFHHKDDTGPVIDTLAEGWYRFLKGHLGGAGRGVSGIEDDDWEQNPTSTDHNEYLGEDTCSKTGTGGLGICGNNTITSYCSACHALFHWQDNTAAGVSPWLRHPADTVLPNSSEYSAYTTYDPLVPIARPDLSAIGSSDQVRPGTDMVICISCHRPHGSPYDDMLRWDYSEMLAGDSSKSGGCFRCHTQKNQTP